jgi:hypothetical protein
MRARFVRLLTSCSVNLVIHAPGSAMALPVYKHRLPIRLAPGEAGRNKDSPMVLALFAMLAHHSLP